MKMKMMKFGRNPEPERSKLSRREVLRLLAVGALAAPFWGRGGSPVAARAAAGSTSPQARNSSRRPIAGRTIVLGAGMAGIAAARTMVDRYGATAPGQVVLLEGRDRIGGRIFTSQELGYGVDLGASWIHGTRRNPIAALAASAGIATDVTDYDAIQVFDSDGSPVAGADYDRIFYGEYEESLRRARRWANARETDPTLAQALAAVDAGAGLTAAERRILDWHWFWELELDLTADLSQLSAWWYDADRALRGPDVVFPGGYTQVVDAAAAGLDIRTSHVVESVDFTGETVTVTTSQGVFEAERCICTLPLGVLKAGDVAFTPGLPPEITDVVAALGFGRAVKIALEFPSAFWGSDRHFFGLLGATREESLELFNVSRFKGQPVLLAEANQDFAATLEAMSENDAVARMMTDLRRAFGAGIPSPTRVVRSDWGSSPFTRGSYSYQAPGSSPRDLRAFSRGVDRKLFFAGEHTSRKYPATVHGAWLSGVFAARKARRGL